MKKIEGKEVAWLFKGMIIMVSILAIVRIILNYTTQSDSLKLLLNWVTFGVVFISFTIYVIVKKPYNK